MSPVDEADMPVHELLDRLAQRLHTPKAEEELRQWTATHDATLPAALLRVAPVPATLVLEHLSNLLVRERLATAQAIVAWAAGDAAAASTLRLAFEATSLPNPDQPFLLVRRIGPELLEVPGTIDVGKVSVSPNGSRILIRASRNDGTGTAPVRSRVVGLAVRIPWRGTPYEALLPWEEHYRAFVGPLNHGVKANPPIAQDQQPAAETTPALSGADPTFEARRSSEVAPPPDQTAHRDPEAPEAAA
jgi:hypothetical protein